MKTVISARRIMSEYNKHAKIKINFYGAKVLQEQARKEAMETGNDAHVEMSWAETKDGITHVIR